MAEPAERIGAEPDAAEALRQDLDGLIRKALSRSYTSYSSQNRIPTGNAYQSVRLRDQVTRGFRTLRGSVLAGLPLKGHKVLDLGCNLGELSRLARDRGAALVDGFEYDSYFVQIGQAVNALNGVTRVSLYRRDVTDPAIYAEPYDVVLSFSVFTYTRRVLPQIAEICKRVLMVETHKVTSEWAKEYIDLVTPYFPHYCIVQRTDWGRDLDGGARLLLVYAREKARISSFFTRRMIELGDDPDGLRMLDVRRSAPHVLARFRAWLADHPYRAVDDLEPVIAKAVARLSAFAAAEDYREGASGITYWLAYFDGFFQFRRDGRVTGDNTYVRYLGHACRDLDIDPYMLQLVEQDQAALRERVRLRFEDTQRAVTGTPMPPILVFNPMPADARLESVLLDCATGKPIRYSHQDGYHRHCSCLLAGVERLGYRTVWYPQAEPFAESMKASPDLKDRLFATLVDGIL